MGFRVVGSPTRLVGQGGSILHIGSIFHIGSILRGGSVSSDVEQLF